MVKRPGLTAGLIALAVAATTVAVSPSGGSVWITNSPSRPSLQVDSRGDALVSWTERGVRKTLLVPPRGEVLPGGQLAGSDVSRPALGVRVPLQVGAVRRTLDGRLWALQEWDVAPRELHLARWQGAPTKLTLALGANALSGTASFAGKPVTGFTSTPAGKRLRIYVYLECFACPAGPPGGWGKMLGVAPRADGTFHVLLRPSWVGKRYRATVAGPNVGATLAPDARVVI